MKHVRPVNFDAFPSDGYGWQVLYNGESCIVIGSNVPPGHAATPHHIHEYSDQLYYVSKGELHVTLGGEEVGAGPNTLVYIPRGTPHHNWNEGDAAEFHLEVIAPAPLPGQPIVTPTDSEDAGDRPYFVKRLDAEGFATELDGFSTQTLLERADDSHHMTLYVAEVQPGAGGPELHVHEFDQFYFVLQGRLAVQVGLKELTAGPYELVVLPAGVPHRQWNEGPEPERHITLIAPEPVPGQEWDVGVRLEAAEAVR